MARRDQLDDPVAIDVTDSNRRQEPGAGSARQRLLSRRVVPLHFRRMTGEISRIHFKGINACRDRAERRSEHLDRVGAFTQCWKVQRPGLGPKRRSRRQVNHTLIHAVDHHLEGGRLTLVGEYGQIGPGEIEPGVGLCAGKRRQEVTVVGVGVFKIIPPALAAEMDQAAGLVFQLHVVPAIRRCLTAPDIDVVGQDRTIEHDDFDRMRARRKPANRQVIDLIDPARGIEHTARHTIDKDLRAAAGGRAANSDVQPLALELKAPDITRC